MTAVFVDTQILLNSEDSADPARQAKALAWLGELWKRRCGRTSMQVLNEFYVSATRRARPPMPSEDARAEVRRYQRWTPWQIDPVTVEFAWAVESRFGLVYRDALIVSAARQLGCRLLLSENLRHRQQIDSVQIINPFLIGPEVLDAAA